MLIDIPGLTIDFDPEKAGASITLTQDFAGTEHVVTMHPCQLKLLAEQIGLAAPDPAAQRTIAALTRQLRLLRDRISALDDMLHQAAARGHEVLDVETTFSFATWELANEFCKGQEQERTADAPVEAESAPRTSA